MIGLTLTKKKIHHTSLSGPKKLYKDETSMIHLTQT